MEQEVSFYHQLVEHPMLVFLVASLLPIIFMWFLGMLMHRRSSKVELGKSSADKSSESTWSAL